MTPNTAEPERLPDGKGETAPPWSGAPETHSYPCPDRSDH